MKILSVALFFLLAFSAIASDGTTGIVVAFVPQPNAPAALVESTHALSDLLQSARLKNQSQKVITSFTMGWAYVLASGPELHSGAVMNVPKGIQPREVYEVSAQAVPLRKDAKDVYFYVAAVKFGDGTDWEVRTDHLLNPSMR